MKRTTTSNLMGIISSKTVMVDNVILRYSSNEPDTVKMDSGKLIESLEFLNESGIFSNAVDWKYDVKKGYIDVFGGRMAPYMDCCIDFKLRLCSGIKMEYLENQLRKADLDYAA